MVNINQFATIASPYWRWRKYGTYYSQLFQTIMPTRENYENSKSIPKTS